MTSRPQQRAKQSFYLTSQLKINSLLDAVSGRLNDAFAVCWEQNWFCLCALHKIMLSQCAVDKISFLISFAGTAKTGPPAEESRIKLPMNTHYSYPNLYPLYLGRIWIIHLNLDMSRIYMNNTRFTHVPISYFFSFLLCSVAPLLMWDPCVGLATLLCTEYLSIILSHLQQISVNFDKIL